MKSWNQLFVRHGWVLVEKGANRFDCTKETEANLAFLQECLERAEVDYKLNDTELRIYQEPVHEADWMKAVDYEFRGRTGAYWCRPGMDEPKIREFDTYIAGIVRQLNRLRFFTTMSCDGHGRRAPFLDFDKEINIDLLTDLLRMLGVPRVTYRDNRLHYHMPIHLKRTELLDLAKALSLIPFDWLEQGVQYVEEQLLYHEMESLLSIPGVSGDESEIRDVVKGKLTPYVDYITEDRYGNVLAEKTFGNGQGPTILLNAHLDTVDEIVASRTIVKDGNIWSSSQGILGADDRAGVAVMLTIARYLYQSNFRGKVKFIYTVEEEVGLVGATHVDNYFLWGVDAAIVLDRRGKGDIVTSCGGIIEFCSEQYGEFFETVAKDIGLVGWACTAGGSSDTRVWASHGIQSVNLSVGYGNEHTEREYLDGHTTYQTYTLLKGVFQKSNELRQVRRISRIESAS